MKDKLKESIGNEDLALKGMPDSTMKEDQDMEKAKTFVKHEQLNTLSRALVVLASASVSDIFGYVAIFISVYLINALSRVTMWIKNSIAVCQ